MSLSAVSRLLSVSLLLLAPCVALANPGGALTRETKLKASDAVPLALFGGSVAISGDTAVIGSTFPGSAYVFVRNAGVWTQQQKLTASNGSPNDFFGISVAVSGDTALVTAPLDDDESADSGAVYVFVRSGGVWTQQQKLTPSDPVENGQFGLSVAVNGDTMLVGAPFKSLFPPPPPGAAYVFVRSGGVWSQQQKLSPSDGNDGDGFGSSVAVAGDTAVVGVPFDSDAGIFVTGSAYVFFRSGGVWTQQQKLTAAGGHFGSSVAVSGETAVIGAPLECDTSVCSAGAAYVFGRAGGVWSQQQKLAASDPGDENGGVFGNSVAVVGEMAVVGAPFESKDHTFFHTGSAYVFLRSFGVWSQQQKLTASDAEAGAYLGTSVAVSGTTAVIGAPNDDSISGSVYVYERELSALSPARVWVGMKNSALDLRAEVFLNSTKVGQGDLNNVSGGGAGFTNALLNTIPLTLTAGSVSASSGSQLSIKVSARRTCFGKGNSGTATLWYNGRPVDGGASRDAGSRFDATIGGTTSDYYLRSGFGLSTTAGSSRTSADAQLNSAAPCPARPYSAFGTWSSTLP